MTGHINTSWRCSCLKIVIHRAFHMRRSSRLFFFAALFLRDCSRLTKLRASDSTIASAVTFFQVWRATRQPWIAPWSFVKRLSQMIPKMPKP